MINCKSRIKSTVWETNNSYVRHDPGHHARLSLPDLEAFGVLYVTMETFEK